MRATIIAFVLALLPAYVHAQEGRSDRSETPIARATANVIVQALPESQYRAWGYRWDSVSIRISRIVRWHIFGPDLRDRASDAIVRRNGWLEAPGAQIGVSVFGGDESVTALSFEYDEFTNLDLLDALRDAGANVAFQSDYETYSEYVVTPPGRESGLLVLSRRCTSENSAAAQHCQNGAELKFRLE
ncbi:MAG: hypothetical protein NT015_00605 [Alphaproteobacteria bacterium]|nr:hypothetical protein [Alphaproteobacteria bacterium]